MKPISLKNNLRSQDTSFAVPSPLGGMQGGELSRGRDFNSPSGLLKADRARVSGDWRLVGQGAQGTSLVQLDAPVLGGVGKGLDLLRLRLLNAASALPVAPRILAQVGQRMTEMECDLEEVASLLRLDAGVTAVVLRVANTAAYNPHETFSCLEEALARLGFAKVYRLVGMAALGQLSSQNLPFYGFTGAHFRQNALLTALIAELLAPAAGACPQSCYTAGILRSIGKLAFDRLTQQVGLQWGEAIDEETERQLFGMNSWEANAILLEVWGFPPETVRGIQEMMDPEPAARLTEVLQMAAGLADRAGHGLPGESFEWAVLPEKMEFLGLTGPKVEEAVRKASKQFSAVRGVLL